MVTRSFVGFGLLLVAGCSGSRTEVVIVADSDLDVPGELDEVVISVASPEGTTQMARAGLGGGNPPLPRTLALLHETGPLGPFSVTATGRQSGATVVVRQAEFTFQPGRSLRLDLDLLGSCRSVSCGPGETCAAGGCRDVAIAPGELRDWTGSVGGNDGADGGASCGDTSSDPRNCGSCGNVCSIANGVAGCAGGRCTVESCEDGFEDCNDDAGDGCEGEIGSDRHCARCNDDCGGRRMCCPDRTCDFSC